MIVITIGVLALQGAFFEHMALLRKAALDHPSQRFDIIEVRSTGDLSRCDALVIPGGESTTLSLVAERSGLLEPLREFVKVERRPTWGTCAGLIFLAESANSTKKGGQELIGGLDVRVHRNHFGRQIDSFEAPLDLPFLKELEGPNGKTVERPAPFHAIFIRAPVVVKVLAHTAGIQTDEAERDDTVVAPSKPPRDAKAAQRVSEQVEILATLPGRRHKGIMETGSQDEEGCDIVAVKQGNVFGTSFHPELTNDTRIHAWWLQEVIRARR